MEYAVYCQYRKSPVLFVKRFSTLEEARRCVAGLINLGYAKAWWAIEQSLDEKAQ